MNTIVYHGVPSWRMASILENGCILPAAEDMHRADPSTDPNELHCILSQCHPGQVNDEIRLAYLWALIGELSAGGTADKAYVLRLRVSDHLVRVEDDTCMIAIPEDGIPLSWVSDVYEFSITPKDLLSAAGFVRWQREDRTKGIIDQMPEDYMDFGMLDDRCIELLRDDLAYKEVPDPFQGDKFMETHICLRGRNCLAGPASVVSRTDTCNLVSDAIRSIMEDAENNEIISVEAVAILWGKLSCGPFVRVIDVAPYFLHMDSMCLHTLLDCRNPVRMADMLVREAATTCPEVAALDMMSVAMTSLKKYVAPHSEDSFQLECHIDVEKAEQWLQEYAPDKWKDITSWRQKRANANV